MSNFTRIAFSGSKENRQNPGCGTAVNSEGQQEVVVAGGYDAEESASEYEVDIYNLVTGTWKTSGNLAHLTYGNSLNYQFL